MRWSLQAKMFIVFAIVATLPLLAMSYLAVTQTQEAFKAEVGSGDLDRASAGAAFVDLYFENARVQVGAEADSPLVREALTDKDEAALLLELRNFQQRTTSEGTPLFATMRVADTNGTVIAAYPLTETPESVADSPSFRLARTSGAARSLAPHTGPDGPYLPLSAPIYVNGTFEGALLTEVSFIGLGRGLQTFASGAQEFLALVDTSGRLLIHPNANESQLDAWVVTLPVTRGLRSESGYAEFTDPLTDERTLAGYAPVTRHGWVIITAEAISSAYAGVGRLTAVLIVLAADLLVAMLLASVVMARAVVKPIRGLTEAADAMAQGRLSTRIEIDGEGEVGDLARSFNQMAERIGSTIEQARRSEERYRGLVESANDMIFTVEADGTFSFASALAERLLGERPTALLHTSASTHIHPDDRATFETATASVFANGKPLSGVQYRIVHGDGTTRTVLTNLSPVMSELGVPGRVLGVSRDITAERAQEHLRERSFEMARVVSEQTEPEPLVRGGLRIILEAAGLRSGSAFLLGPEGLRLTALEGVPLDRPLEWARAAETLMPAAENALEEVYERPTPPQLASLEAPVVFATPLIERSETLGLILLFGDSSSALGADKRQAIGALASQLAVGVRRGQFEARLREYTTQLESKVEERTALLVEKTQEMESFLYTVSHDLKAPLISIEGYAQGITEDFGDVLPEDGRFYLDRIRKNAELMESLIADLLEFSRIGRVSETAGAVDANTLLRDIAAHLAAEFDAAEGKVTIEGELPQVHGERKRITQLFTNLLGNALKYRHASRPPKVVVTARVDGDEAIFEVKDNGRGFPENARDKVFQIFQRFPSTGMEDPGGTGMGLAIVKRIAEMHGGRVWYESREGEGTTISVALPLRGDEAS